jgi:hypothetical protein
MEAEIMAAGETFNCEIFKKNYGRWKFQLDKTL